MAPTRTTEPSHSSTGHRFDVVTRAFTNPRTNFRSLDITVPSRERILKGQNGEAGSPGVLQHVLRIDLVIASFIGARPSSPRGCHRFNDDQAAVRLQRAAKSRQYQVVLLHLVVRVHDQCGIQGRFGQLRIVRRTFDYCDVLYAIVL